MMEPNAELQDKLKKYTQTMDEITGMSLYKVNHALAKALEL